MTGRRRAGCHAGRTAQVLVAALVVSSGTGFVTGAAGSAQGSASAKDIPLVVVTRPVHSGPERHVDLPGSFEPYQKVELHARVTGYVARVSVDIGDRVERATPLVRLQVPEMEAELAEARADAAVAEAVLKQEEANRKLASVTLERLSKLKEQEPMAVMQQDVDVARARQEVSAAKVETAHAQVRVAQAKLARLQALQEYSVIRAPFDGVVVERLVDPGALVVAGEDGGGPVAVFARVDRLRLVIYVPERVASQVRPGTDVSISVDAIAGREFKASVSRIAGALSSKTRNMRAEIDMSSEQGLLRPGMYATVRLHLEGEAGEILLPASTVHREPEGAFIWAVHDGVVSRVPVQIARSDGDQVVVASHLEPGTLVVLAAPTDLRPGQTVRIQQQGEAR
ncbi:MAG: efflux RND transporter periplasmic adaptor subunit [Acidobacteriota bacterium]